MSCAQQCSVFGSPWTSAGCHCRSSTASLLSFTLLHRTAVVLPYHCHACLMTPRTVTPWGCPTRWEDCCSSGDTALNERVTKAGLAGYTAALPCTAPRGAAMHFSGRTCRPGGPHIPSSSPGLGTSGVLHTDGKNPRRFDPKFWDPPLLIYNPSPRLFKKRTCPKSAQNPRRCPLNSAARFFFDSAF